MFPWSWFWAPQLHFPFSGAVSQSIDPDNTWFSTLIKPEAGNARIEERAFSVASYGKQLGLLTDLLIDLAEHSPERSTAAQLALDKLRAIRAAIDTIKEEEYGAAAARIVSEIAELKQRDGEGFAQLADTLRPLLDADAGKGAG